MWDEGRKTGDPPPPRLVRRAAITIGLFFALFPILFFDCFRMGGACMGLGVWPGVILATRLVATRERPVPLEGARIGFLVGGGAAVLRVLLALAFGLGSWKSIPLDEAVERARETLERLGYFQGLGEEERARALRELLDAQVFLQHYGDALTAVLHALGGAAVGAAAAFMIRRRREREARGS